ncbi:MAG: RluA family pseudouridine synthase [Lachnospiraceae bacterium]|nr:RluA family pseudouridine synthase [Lachnospiraceae bacterium]
MKEIIITSADAGGRLDKYLIRYFAEASMGFIYKMLRKKNIKLNDAKASGKEILNENDCIKVYFSDETFAKLKGASKDIFLDVSSDIDVIYEDKDILIVNKPAGVLSQKATASDISINEMILSYLMKTKQINEDSIHGFKPSIANRLDRNTSGLILAGKTLKGQQYLSQALKERSCKKIYHAIVAGELDREIDLSGYLLKNEGTNEVQILKSFQEGAKEIKTHIVPLKTSGRYTLVQVHLITGRTHQIRAHLSSIGYPIIGDYKYGVEALNARAKKQYGVKSQLLHAYSIEFEDGNKFVAPTPDIFDRLIK